MNIKSLYKKPILILILLMVISAIIFIGLGQINFTKLLGGYIFLVYLLPYLVAIPVYFIMKNKFKIGCTECDKNNIL